LKRSGATTPTDLLFDFPTLRLYRPRRDLGPAGLGGLKRGERQMSNPFEEPDADYTVLRNLSNPHPLWPAVPAVGR
jgi:hypothetical protein